jgi:hypothetical protein
MRRAVVLVALCASVLFPVVASAQDGGPPAGPPPGGMGRGNWPSPSPAMRAAMEKAHADAKAGALAALTPAHAASVQSILAQVTAGTLDRRAAAGQIDALLTPAESAAVVAAAEQARRAMHAAMAAGGPPPPPSGGPPDGPPPGRGMFGPPTAGRLFLMLSMPPPGMRMTQPTARSSAAP